MAFGIVEPNIIQKDLLKGDVIILHSPENSAVWYLYGDSFRLNEIIDGSYLINCRCAGAKQFGGRILVIYRRSNGKIRRMRFNKGMNFYKEMYHGRSR